MLDVKIQPETIPEHAQKRIYKDLAKAVRQAFRDPQVQKEYEKWKAERDAACAVRK
jgi:hypothetical protein